MARNPPIQPALTTANLSLPVEASNAVNPSPSPPTSGNSGTWVICPGILSVEWSLTGVNTSIAVKLLNLWTIDTLTGTLSPTTLALAETLDLEIVEGSLSFTATLPPPGGIAVAGDLIILGKQIENFNHMLVAW